MHISHLAWEHIDRTEDVCRVGDKMQVKVIDVDDEGKIRFDTSGIAIHYQSNSTSRCDDGNLGIAEAMLLTEANRGDYSVRLVHGQRRPIEEVISHLRATIRERVPTLRIEFVQILQDMIGDLSGRPEPVEIKLFGSDARVLERAAVATELLDHISDKDIQSQTKDFVNQIAVPAETFARMVAFAINEPADVDVNEILFRPTAQPI